ncbi:hypothetical protein Agub_g2650, partial [Astrephomene gubernaculifera]
AGVTHGSQHLPATAGMAGAEAAAAAAPGPLPPPQQQEQQRPKQLQHPAVPELLPGAQERREREQRQLEQQMEQPQEQQEQHQVPLLTPQPQQQQQQEPRMGTAASPQQSSRDVRRALRRLRFSPQGSILKSVPLRGGTAGVTDAVGTGCMSPLPPLLGSPVGLPAVATGLALAATMTPLPSPVSPVPSLVSPIPSPVSPVPSPVSPIPSPVSPVPSPVSPIPSPVSPVMSPVSPPPLETPLTTAAGLEATREPLGPASLGGGRRKVAPTAPSAARGVGMGIPRGARPVLAAVEALLAPQPERLPPPPPPPLTAAGAATAAVAAAEEGEEEEGEDTGAGALSALASAACSPVGSVCEAPPPGAVAVAGGGAAAGGSGEASEEGEASPGRSPRPAHRRTTRRVRSRSPRRSPDVIIRRRRQDNRSPERPRGHDEPHGTGHEERSRGMPSPRPMGQMGSVGPVGRGSGGRSPMSEYESALYRLLAAHPCGLTMAQIRKQLPIPPALLRGGRPFGFMRDRAHLYMQVDPDHFTANPEGR